MKIEQANLIRYKYRLGYITIKQAKKDLQPFINKFNNKSIKIAKKYKQRPKLFSFNSFMR